jgi:glutathione peroxidase
MKGDYRYLAILMGVSIIFADAALTWIVRAIAAETPAAAMTGAGFSKNTPVTVYDFEVKTIDGEVVGLGQYKGKVLLIVNTASRCGFTPQYDGLEKLYAKYKDRGFEVLAFPANNFMGQEPGTDAEIKQFCALKFKTTFPLFSKISVKGDNIHPLYRFLITRPGLEGDVSWNFTKFLIGPDGKVAARFGSRQDPLSAELTGAVEALLADTQGSVS